MIIDEIVTLFLYPHNECYYVDRIYIKIIYSREYLQKNAVIIDQLMLLN